MRIRHIKTETKVIDGKERVVPVLNEQGQEIELWAVDVPRAIAAEGIPKEIDSTDKAALEGYIAAELEKEKRRAAGETVPAGSVPDVPAKPRTRSNS